MQQLQVARLAAPPAVMLAQLQALAVTPPVSATLFTNPTLLLRALDALHRTAAFAVTLPLGTRLAQLDSPWLETLTRRSALQLALQDSPVNHAFLLRHWYLSRQLVLLATGLAQASAYPDVNGAACCAALLRAGMLILDQQQSAAYAALTAGGWQQQLQLPAERELFQLDHVEAAVRLLESWALDQFSIDAVRYQAQPLEHILDAAPLVKICWYANALAESQTPVLQRSGRDLLGLGADQVQALFETTRATLAAECAALGLPDLRAHASRSELAQEAQQKLQQLRHEISIDNLLAQHTEGRVNACPEQQLARLLQDAGIDPVFIVLEAHSGQTLHLRFSHRVPPEAGALTLVCAPGRNVLSTLILKRDAGVLSADLPELTVIDRQLLTMLGGQTVLCEPLQEGERRCVLLLGLTATAVSTYLTQHTLRRFIARMLLAAPKEQTHEAHGGDALLLQQRVREAVHEANNPLTIIKNYLYLLGMKQGDGQIPEELQLIRAEIDRVAKILGDLRAPPAPSAPRPLALNRVMSTMHRLFAGSLNTDGKRIAVNLQLDDGDPQVVANENALKQILTNLVKNAAEALGATGTITLGTQARVFLNDRFYAQLSVRDDGPGIAPQLMAQMFKPGTSTKASAHAGSGLGIVRRLVEELGGQISCRSSSTGTAMDILLPLATQDNNEN